MYFIDTFSFPNELRRDGNGLCRTLMQKVCEEDLPQVEAFNCLGLLFTSEKREGLKLLLLSAVVAVMIYRGEEGALDWLVNPRSHPHPVLATWRLCCEIW